MKWRIGTGLLVALLVLMSATAVWAQGNTGAIAGKVVDDQGQPIPGAEVSVTSAFLQGPRGTATNVDGEFVIPYLPPASDYKLTAQAQGFNKVVQSNLTVKLGSTTTLEISLVGGGTEVQVTARPPVVTLKETKISTNISQQELETLPIGRQYQDTLYLAPDVSGSGMGGNPGVAGSTGSENIFQVNGLNTTDPVTGTFGTNLNYNFIREMEVNTGGLEAEYGASTGGLFNVLTKSGTNEFHGEVFAYYVNENLTAQPQATDFQHNLKPQPYHNYDYGFDIGGPILKDRLWFFVGYNPTLFTRHYEGNFAATNYGSYTTNYGATLNFPYAFDDLSRNWFWSAKFNYRVNDRHNLELSVFSDPSHMWYNEGAGGGAYAWADQSARLTRRYQGGYNVALKWYATWSNNFFMDAGIGKTHGRLDILPWDHAGYGEPEILNLDFSPTVSVGKGVGNYIWDDRDTDQFEAKFTYLVGKHEIKFGAQAEELKWNSYSDYSGGYLDYLLYQFYGPTISANPADYYYTLRYYNQNPRSYEKGSYQALFAQDKWSINDYLTLSYGLRWEKNEIKPGNNGQHLSVDSLSPRLGLSWDWARNGKSKFYMNWGRYYQRLPIAMASSMDPGHASYRDVLHFGSYLYTDTYSAVPTTVLSGVKNQFTDEFVIGNDYEISPDLTLGFRGVIRNLGRVIEDVGYIDNTGNVSYIVMNPGQQWPAIMDRWASAVPDYEKFPSPIRNYQGYTITLNKRFTNRWFLNASYTWSRLVGNYEGGSGGYSLAGLNPGASAAYDIPQSILINNRYGYLPQDIRHYLKVQGSYKFDFGLILGANFILRSGRPLDKQMGYPYNDIGYGTILTAPRGSNRLPGVWQLDIHAEYDFKLWKTDMAFFADIFNVTNRQTATAKYDTYWRTPDTTQQILNGSWFANPNNRDMNWGLTSARQTGRNMRLGVKWSF